MNNRKIEVNYDKLEICINYLYEKSCCEINNNRVKEIIRWLQDCDEVVTPQEK